MGRAAEPEYELIRRDGSIDVRRYGPLIVAEVGVTGTRQAAANTGFRMLAGYIFGANVPITRAAAADLTSNRSGEKIAMTKPVIQEPCGRDAHGKDWTVRFVMPPGMSLRTLPRPTSPEIRLTELPPRILAAKRFSGRGSEAKLRAETAELLSWLRQNRLEAEGAVQYGFYDPPWVLPWRRRNEVMVTSNAPSSP